MLKKVAVFISGGGSNLQSLLDYESGYEIALVISDKENAKGLLRAEEHSVKNYYIGKSNFPNKNERYSKIIRLLEENNIDVIVLAGYLSIVPKIITDKFEKKIINIHPSLIPSFCGMGFYGEKVHKAVYESGVKLTGATVHFVDDKVDTGEIILQECVSIIDEDTPETIAEKVLKIEHSILPKALEYVCLEKVKFDGRRTILLND